LRNAASAEKPKNAGSAKVLPGWFLDTSALAKLYHAEQGTERMRSIAQDSGNRLWISGLAVVEFSSVSATKVRTGFLHREDAAVLLRRFGQELVSGRFGLYAIGEAEFSFAGRLIERYASDIGLRSLDAIQIAAAVGLRGGGLIEYVVVCSRPRLMSPSIEPLRNGRPI
jgi:predicted nucleic acid-binding protein